MKLRLLIILLLSYTQLTRPMDLALASNSERALHALLTECGHRFGHDDFHTLAMVNKLCRKAIFDKADERKKGFGEYIKKQEFPFRQQFMMWNAYGSVCSTVYLQPTQRASSIANQKCKNLFLRQYQLNRNQVVSCRKGEWPDLICCLPHNPAPFIAKDGTMRFYGCGHELIPTQSSQIYIQGHPQIFQFSLSAEGNTEKRQCYISYDSTDDGYTMIQFLDFPVLLKALLNSMRKEYKKVGVADAIEIYHLDGTLLPDDYTTYQKIRGRWNSFDELPETIKSPIVDYYNICKGLEQENKELRSQQKPDAPVILQSGETTEGWPSFVYDKVWYKSKYAPLLHHATHSAFWPKFINYRLNIVINKDQEYKYCCNDMLTYGGVYFPEHEIIVAGTQDIDGALVCINNLIKKS